MLTATEDGLRRVQEQRTLDGLRGLANGLAGLFLSDKSMHDTLAVYVASVMTGATRRERRADVGIEELVEFIDGHLGQVDQVIERAFPQTERKGAKDAE